MALIKRVTRLLKADIHAVLDTVEEPQILLKQAIREMEDDVARDQQQLKLFQKDQQHLESKLKQTTQNLSSIESDLNICFESDNEQLARSAVKRKLASHRLQQTLIRKQKTTAMDINELNQRLSDKATRLEAMRQKQEILTEETYNDSLPIVDEISISEDEVDIALLQEKQKRKAS